MGKVMRHTLGASLNIRHNLSSRSEERFSRNAETDLVCRLLLEKKKNTKKKEKKKEDDIPTTPRILFLSTPRALCVCSRRHNTPPLPTRQRITSQHRTRLGACSS